MSCIVLFEDSGFAKLLPLVYWRGVGELLCGRKSLLDHTAFRLRRPVDGLWTRSYLAGVCEHRLQIPVNRRATADTVLVNSRWVVSGPVEFAKPPCVGVCKGSIVYIACDPGLAERISPEMLLDVAACDRLIKDGPCEEVDADLVEYPWDLISRNFDALHDQWTGDDRGIEGKVSSAAYLVNANHVHISDRSEVKPTAVIDAERGPVYISNDVLIDVHTYVEGPCYIGPGSVVKPHSSIRAGTSLGAMCKVGGEISGSIIAGNSNKQHEGFLGDSYIGGWVNLAAGVTTSNLKTTYGPVNASLGGRDIPTGRQFFGCVIGDFARLGIGELVPTGAVIGFAAMVATGGICDKFVPSFAWHTAQGREKSDTHKVIETAQAMMKRRNHDLCDDERQLLERLAALAEEYGI